jgi:hypothetical protein
MKKYSGLVRRSSSPLALSSSSLSLPSSYICFFNSIKNNSREFSSSGDDDNNNSKDNDDNNKNRGNSVKGATIAYYRDSFKSTSRESIFSQLKKNLRPESEVFPSQSAGAYEDSSTKPSVTITRVPRIANKKYPNRSANAAPGSFNRFPTATGNYHSRWLLFTGDIPITYRLFKCTGLYVYPPCWGCIST